MSVDAQLGLFVCFNADVPKALDLSGLRQGDLGEVLEFMRLLWALDHALQSRSKSMRRELGLTGPQRFTIRLVGRFPQVSARDLAALLRLDPSTLTGILQRLETKRLLKRESDPADARRARFQLTDRGRKADVPAPRTVEAAMRRALSKVSKKRLDVVRGVLTVIVGELEREDGAENGRSRVPKSQKRVAIVRH